MIINNLEMFLKNWIIYNWEQKIKRLNCKYQISSSRYGLNGEKGCVTFEHSKVKVQINIWNNGDADLMFLAGDKFITGHRNLENSKELLGILELGTKIVQRYSEARLHKS